MARGRHPLEDPDLVPAGLHVVVLDGEHHKEHEEQSHRREEVPEVVVVEDQDGARCIQVSVEGEMQDKQS